MTSVKGWSLACLLAVAALVGCGDDDGGAGTGAGVGGSGGSAGVGDDDGGSGTGGSAGVSDTDGGSGTGGVGGTGGAGGTGGTAGTSGTGGVGGTAGTGGTGGMPCSTNCNDSNDCTIDSCENGTCVNVINPAACGDGESCHPTRGCEQGGACSNPGDCADTDGCTTQESCNTQMARCEWQPLDNDGDGQSPASCGGGDCNDADQMTFTGAVDTCNGDDDDCDEAIDEDATCEDGESCINGACICPEGKNVCSGQCVDRQTSEDHCGSCGNSCGEAGVCEDGDCTCPSPGALCSSGGLGGMRCVNTETSHNNCGGCGTVCDDLEYCNDGVCEACGGMGEPCCGTSADTINDDDGCPGSDLLCVGLRERELSVCTCPNDHMLCGNDCVDPMVDNQHCGQCGETCSGGLVGVASETCIAGSCVECGQEVDQPCCEVGSLIGGPMLSCNNALNPLLRCNPATKLCRLGLF